MPTYAWGPFLLEWEREIFASRLYREDRQYLATDLAQRHTLRNPGASEEQLRALEIRLNATLPPSYREFLSYTNGWYQVGLEIEQLWSTEEVEWFATRNQDWIDNWLSGYGDPILVSDEEYLDYGSSHATPIRTEYLNTLLEISNGEGKVEIYVLNPKIITPEGEWEAWRFEEDLARYPSFWDLMQAQREVFRYLENHLP